jgi:Ca2+-transporting ATPase
MIWYNLAADEALKALEVDQKSGLTDTEVAKRFAESGANELAQEQKAPVWHLLLKELKNPLILILIVGAFLSLYIGHTVDAIVILVIVLINVLISFTQELNMQKSMDSLSDMAAPMAVVMRNGDWEKIPARILVPGDILKLNTGTIVSADVRLLETTGLLIDEAALTGESLPVEKELTAISQNDVGIGDQINMAFMGTIISTGHGIGVVTATGMQTQMGYIADMLLKTEESKTPLQLRIEVLSKILLAAALTIVAVIVGIGIEKGMDWMEIVNTAISLTVAAIPEGLPTVVTVVLTLGAKRMVRNKALVRKLSSVETLGSASVICSDKTGTLTQNKMQVLSIYSGGHYYDVSGDGYNPSGIFTNEMDEEVNPRDIDELYHFLEMSAGCNDALLIERDGIHTIMGMPTEGALTVVTAKANITKQDLLDDGAEFIHSFPFDSSRKLMSIVVKTKEGQYYVIAKGAPDVLLQRSDSIYLHQESVSIDNNTEKHIHEAIDNFSSKALRTLAVAYKAIEPDHLQLTQDEYESGFTFLGIHGIMDPPRKEVPEAIEECRTAGIRTIMITGDHAGTAEAIARQIGMKRSDNESVFTGSEIEGMTETELIDAVEHAVVFARVTPEHKLRIIKALQSRGEVVAMTGDGVNDAPALRTADIGIAMGITGTDVAKDASDLILIDDNFSTIVKAVREGRRIYDNLKKFIRQGLTANVSEVSALLFAFLLMGEDPLLTLAPLMILWVNLVSDGIPSLALGVDNEEEGIMKRKPISSKEGFFANNLASKIVLRGLVLGFTTYFMFQYALNKGATLEYAQTIAFMTLIFGQIFHIFDARTFSTLYCRNPWNNRYLLAAVGGSALVSIALIYSGLGTMVFGTEPLAFKHLVMVIAIAALPTFVLSGLKEIFNIKWI